MQNRPHIRKVFGIGLILSSLTLFASALAQPQSPYSDPKEVKFITTDVDRFWAAYEKALKDPKPEAIMQDEYLTGGTPALTEFVQARIQTADDLWDKVNTRKQFYNSIRANSIALGRSVAVRNQISRNFTRLKTLYPDARFTDIYFVVGKLNSVGTVSTNGIIVPTEIFTKGTPVITTEANAWERNLLQTPNQVAFQVTHSLVHNLQDEAGLDYSGPQTLLKQALTEGGADFIAFLASGEKPGLSYYAYGLSRERELWLAFTRDMNGTDVSKWMYQSEVSNTPKDLGYFIGYRIAEAYYAQAKDKVVAIKDLLQIKRPEQILALSGYARKFSSP